MITRSMNTDTISKILSYNYGKATQQVSTSLENLLTGYTVNESSDAPATYAVTQGLNADILKHNSAMENAQSAANYTELASEKTTEIKTLLKEMKILAENATSPDLTETERNELQQEADERLEKILDIQNKTTFNGIKVLGEASQTSQIMNVHIGTSSAAGMTTFDSYYNVGSLSVDLSSSESSTNAIENLDDLIQLADVKINQMNYQNEKYVNSVTEHATDILELNDSIKAMIGTNETVENAKLSNAQTLQDTCQYLISQLANINKDVITTLLPKSYSYSK